MAGTQDVFIFANSLVDIRPAQVDWDCLKSLHAPVIPQISDRPFQIIQHMGVIVIPSGICSDKSRTLIDKLAEGTIYNHKGTYSVLAFSGPGRKIPKPELKVIRALEFIGKTSMCLCELDYICKMSSSYVFRLPCSHYYYKELDANCKLMI